MKVGNVYILKPNITIDDFFDTTSKSEFSMHLRENNKMCSPIRIEPGPVGKIAFFTFENSPYEYDLPDSYWDLFVEVDEEPVPVSVDTQSVNQYEYKMTGNSSQSYPAKIGLNTSDFTIKNLNIHTETAKRLEKLEIIEEPGLRTQDLVKFIFDYIICEHPVFGISSILLSKSSEEKERVLWDVYKAYHAKIGIDNVVALALAEQSRLDTILDSYSYDPLGASSGIF